MLGQGPGGHFKELLPPALHGAVSRGALHRLRILRQAFDQTLRSDDLVAEAKKRNMDIHPKSGEELDKLFAAAGSPTPETIKHVARVMGIDN